jgi:uncharacterized repeat protein (TIGR01451 family)
MRNWVGGRTGNYHQAIFLALVAGSLLLAPFTVVFGQASPKRPSKPKHYAQSKQHAQSKTAPQLNLTQAPVIPGMPFVHIVPYGTPVKQIHPPLSSAGGRFPYWGGPVMSNIHLVEVLWGSFVDAPSTTGLPQFLTDIPNSNYFDLLSEYGTVGVNGQGGAPGSNQLIGRGFFDGKFTIAPSVCPGSASNPPRTCTVTDVQIQAELKKQLPHLPAPVTDQQGNYNTIYLFYFPPGVHISLQGIPSCAQGGFCAYHASIAGGLPAEIPYGVFPDFGPTSGCGPSSGCGNSTSANNLTSVTSHEIGEAVTDENVANAQQLGPPLAWLSNTDDEIGDICNQDQQQITVGTHTYTVQTLFSNMQNGCVTAPAQLALTGPTGAIPARAVNLTLSASPSFGGVLSQYSNTVHFTSSDAQAVLPADYTFDPATDLGSHTFSVTLNSLNSQTVTVTDTLAAPLTATATLDVRHNPDLTISKTHTGSFSQGQTGHYTLSVGNAGDIPTAGAVTVTDSLPPDLTATAMAGTGWTCTLAALTCTRADVLAASASYPPITLTVKVSDSAQASIINIATVSGGGEANLINDQSSDPTTVIQFPDPTPYLSDSANFSQGAKGLQYSVTIQNLGNAPTTGTVTLAVALGTGLTATSIAGTNWSCVLATLRCSRADSIPGFTYYDPIQITVNVALNAPTTVNATATVSGGGEIITANDIATDSTPVTGPVPDFVIASAHTGSFTQGQSGATFRATVSNTGPAASAGLVTVTDFLDNGLTATAVTGAGWTCALSSPPLVCTRSDALAAASNYPPIIVTVDVSSSAGTPLNNTVSISGGNELNASNDSAIDPVNITGVPDLTGISFHQGNFGQGQTGATYILSVINNGGAPSVGPITLTDTLPTGLTATAMSGTGWNCTLATLTCTSSDPVSYASAPITLTVNVALNAPSSVTNVVTAAGGGETNTTIDSLSDVTQIAPPVSLTVFNGGSQVTAGQPATFGITVASFAPDPVVLSCTGLPANTACSFSPPSVTGQTNALLTISTMAPTRSAALRPRNMSAPLYQEPIGQGKGKTRSIRHCSRPHVPVRMRRRQQQHSNTSAHPARWHAPRNLHGHSHRCRQRRQPASEYHRYIKRELEWTVSVAVPLQSSLLAGVGKFASRRMRGTLSCTASRLRRPSDAATHLPECNRYRGSGVCSEAFRASQQTRQEKSRHLSRSRHRSRRSPLRKI